MTALNPWIILGIVLAFAGVGTGAYIKGGTDASNRIEARTARETSIHQRAYEAAMRGTAEIIVKTDVMHTAGEVRAREIIREVPVYRDCVADPDLVRLLDDARANRTPSVSTGNPELPGGTPARSPR
jgi:hypothetical protein